MMNAILYFGTTQKNVSLQDGGTTTFMADVTSNGQKMIDFRNSGSLILDPLLSDVSVNNLSKVELYYNSNLFKSYEGFTNMFYRLTMLTDGTPIEVLHCDF